MLSDRLQIFQPARRTIVNHGDRLSVRQQSFHQMGADKARAAGYQNIGMIAHAAPYSAAEAAPDKSEASLTATPSRVGQIVVTEGWARIQSAAAAKSSTTTARWPGADRQLVLLFPAVAGAHQDAFPGPRVPAAFQVNHFVADHITVRQADAKFLPCVK